MSDVLNTMRLAQAALQRLMRQDGGRCPECHSDSYTHTTDCKAHVAYGELAVSIALEQRARSLAPTPALMRVVRQLIDHEAQAFEAGTEVNGGDLVAWWAERREELQGLYEQALRITTQGGAAH